MRDSVRCDGENGRVVVEESCGLSWSEESGEAIGGVLVCVEEFCWMRIRREGVED